MSATASDAVLFDLDGTLLDTIEDLAAAMNAAIEGQGLATAPTSEHKLMVGNGVTNYILRALPADRRDDQDLVERVRAVYRDIYARSWSIHTRPYEGIVDMLTALVDRGLRLAVLSNKPDGFTREMVAHFLPETPFEIVRGAVDGVPLKPDPQSALAIASEMGVPPKRFLYLGDTATDMRTACAAGMFAIGVLWGFREREELLAAGAQALITHPRDMLKYA